MFLFYIFHLLFKPYFENLWDLLHYMKHRITVLCQCFKLLDFLTDVLQSTAFYLGVHLVDGQQDLSEQGVHVGLFLLHNRLQILQSFLQVVYLGVDVVGIVRRTPGNIGMSIKEKGFYSCINDQIDKNKHQQVEK